MLDKKTMIVLVIVLVALIIGLFWVWHLIFGRPNPPLAGTTVRVGPATFSVELATSTIAQARGLSGRVSLGADDGMLFIFGSPGIQNFWMKDMNFPIDIIWIGGGKVLGFEQNAPIPKPGAMLWQLPIYTSPDGVDTVLEVNAGIVTKNNIKVGDAVAEIGI
jgi:uncharacterized membrane protein (UPF0127 family)